MAAIYEEAGEVCADEAGGAGDEDAIACNHENLKSQTLSPDFTGQIHFDGYCFASFCQDSLFVGLWRIIFVIINIDSLTLVDIATFNLILEICTVKIVLIVNANLTLTIFTLRLLNP